MIAPDSLYTKRQQDRAAAAVRRIGEKPTSIVFRKPDGTRLPAQTLRVEVNNRAALATSAAGAAPAMGVVVFGWRDHATLPDSDIGEGYIFNLDQDQYRIEDVIRTLGEIQGVGVATG